jgi:Glu/Leu/Phe/Val dehydrogenase, dimerisation domain
LIVEHRSEEGKMDVTGGPLGDEVGPRKTVLLCEPRVGIEAIVVVDNIGPAIGGVRMAPDVTLAEVGRLARAMTFKNAAAGLSHIALRLTSWDQRGQLKCFLTEVAPAFTPHAQGRSRS